ncbi:MAG: GtrA-like protein [Verrucomicrobiales bacterium]|nr:GtrA-like protein [Verrucomicrobiales bacterium]
MIRQLTKALESVLLEHSARLFRFGCVGVVVFGLDSSLVYVLGKKLPPIVAVSIAYFLAVCLHFCLSRWWVFGSKTACTLKEVLSYAMTATLCWCCTVLCVQAALAWLTDNLLLAKMAAVVPTMALGFCLMRLVVFQQSRPVEGTLS